MREGLKQKYGGWSERLRRRVGNSKNFKRFAYRTNMFLRLKGKKIGKSLEKARKVVLRN